ncbi:Gfo/Idh/MocA family oxidoreductase [Nocardioides sp. cx-169]|uniref:Gfo/Idh/MocA family protein n=1 Tax=Nocardioides sp. cx-169 TaxID=2899080 RepID=UPI001E4610A3|nr:Gfo/Idh/MocA family oxidoreductase [Nocardioides sp. cx-169]MCD4533854.1 Gfo/Idh/MocA family oxidoreductase [Nocardioides sp. cx-169]
MARTTRWGILATGKIAHKLAADLALTPDNELVAVGSRRSESAQAFAQQYGVPAAYGSYEELVADPAVDVVYVATPHALHLECARLAFAAGKHVLCEKPLTLNIAEAAEMVRLAREHDRFLMEAMWMACNPVIRRLGDDMRAGRFGTPRQAHAELGFRVDESPEHRLLNPDLGGGALLDMGIYPLTFAHLMLGPAEELTATATLSGPSGSGVDLDVAITGRYAGGALATMCASLTSWSSRAASVATDEGRLEVPPEFHHPRYAVWTPVGGEPERIEAGEPVIGEGYGNEIAEVGRCVQAGLRESPLVPLDRTLLLMRQMDDLRRQVGVRYASD